MRELWPTPTADLDDDDVLARYAADPRPAPEGRPWVLVNMIATVDGATAVEGRSGGLGGPGDRTVFRAVRAVPDVIVVGAATVRAEAYGPPRPSAAVRATRQARGQAPAPRLVVVSGALDLDPGQALFTEAEVAPLVVTGADPDPAAARRLEAVAEVVPLGPGRVQPAALLAHLHALGVATVLCEGGPSLNGQVVAAGLVDEWCATVAPLLAAGGSARAAHSPDPVAPHALGLQRVLADDEGYLFLRYARP